MQHNKAFFYVAELCFMISRSIYEHMILSDHMILHDQVIDYKITVLAFTSCRNNYCSAIYEGLTLVSNAQFEMCAA